MLSFFYRIETVRSILDILNICATIPQVMLQLCEVIEPPDEANNVGLNVILGAAEGEIVADPEVQKAALNVLITCVCAPMNRVSLIFEFCRKCHYGLF